VELTAYVAAMGKASGLTRRALARGVERLEERLL
jgi:hypothetical protein